MTEYDNYRDEGFKKLDHSPNGLCPQCGTELERETREEWWGVHQNVYMVIMQDFCPHCGWESDVMYDA